MLPSINQRIKNIIDERFQGNVTAFSNALGYKSSQKINRLFKIDDRTKNYPVPSTEVLIEISNKFDISLDLLIKGSDSICHKKGEGDQIFDELISQVKKNEGLFRQIIAGKDKEIEIKDKIIILLENQVKGR